jgi:hypothetical protein
VFIFPICSLLLVPLVAGYAMDSLIIDAFVWDI